MKLRTKIILVATSASSLVSALLGTIAATSNWNSSITAVDSKLALLARTVCATSDPLDAALLQVDSVGSETEIAFFSINKDLTVLGDNTAIIKTKPSMNQLRSAAKHPVTMSPKRGDIYQMRTCAMPDREFVVFATNLQNAKNDFYQTLEIMALSTAILVLGGAITIWLLTRKDLRRIETLIAKAHRISQGELNIMLEPTKGNSELDQLNNALADMLQTLNAVLEKERNIQSKMKTFIADASHELKTPLTLIRGYSELAHNNPKVEERDKNIDRVYSQIDRMQSLVNDLLLLAQLEEQTPIETQEINLSQIVTSAAGDYKVLHPIREINLEIEPNVFINGSQRLIEQLLANIISNLSRHLEDQNSVTINLKTVDHWAVLEIADDGSGLPEKAYEIGVQRFERFDNSRARQTGGTGLGMSIMAAIVESHHGMFKLSPSKLGGLQTTISLPLPTRNS